jgi:tetratricopeptide (TPR) repeat protein
VKIHIALLGLLIWTKIPQAHAQSATELRETGRQFMQQGDFANAVLVLNRALEAAPGNIDVVKDLTLAYYFQNESAKALTIIKPLLDRDEADEQCFQIAANLYKQLVLPKESDKLYRKALKKYPESGPLYNDFGELLWAQQDYNAIKQWEKGIETDPGFSKNYYNASKYYYLTADVVWTIYYAEIFINIEPLSNKATEIRNILLDSYKKLFAGSSLPTAKAANPGQFEKWYSASMGKQSAAANFGINTESLTMIRTRFLLDWFAGAAASMPVKLFEYHRQLLQEGMFEAYNQWLFGPAQNLAAYQNWVNNNAAAYNEFSRFQKGRVFKIPAGQYYR